MQLLSLPHAATLVVPVYDKDGSKIDHVSIREAMAAQFGGCTYTQGTGAWIADCGRLDDEPVGIFNANAETIPHAVLCTGAWVLATTSQDAVYTAIDGKANILSR